MSDTLFSNQSDGLLTDSGSYRFPPLALLSTPDEIVSDDELIAEENTIRETLLKALKELKITIEEQITYTVSPTVICYEVVPVTPKDVRKLLKGEDDLDFYFNGIKIRTYICHEKERLIIEIPRSYRRTLYLREVMESDAFVNANGDLKAAIGVDAAGANTVIDITKMPHLLIGGTTGSGKTIFINNVLLSLLYTKTPDELKLILIDPKKVELSSYRDLPHLLTPVISSPKEAANALMGAVEMMEARFDLFEQMQVRNIKEYNQNVCGEKLPYVVIVIEELADLMISCRKDIEDPIARLAQKSRATGIHLIISTQRLAKDVLSTIITANIPSRIAMATVCKKESELVLREPGAERLRSRGDMLFWPIGGLAPMRAQCCFENYSTVDKICEYIRTSNAPIEYDEAIRARIEKHKNANISEEETLKSDCLFCKIIAGEIPSTKVYEDKYVYAFRDIEPMAPVHVLIVPKVHIASADGINAANSSYVARIFQAIPKIAAAEGLTNGYRVITNCGEDGCQTVKHLHFHILGGKKLPESLA